MDCRTALKKRLKQRRTLHEPSRCPVVQEEFQGDGLDLLILDLSTHTYLPETEEWWHSHQQDCRQCRDFAAFNQLVDDLLDGLTDCYDFCRLFLTLLPARKRQTLSESVIEELLLSHCEECEECRPYKEMLKYNMANVKKIILFR